MTLESGNASTPVAAATLLWHWPAALAGGLIGSLLWLVTINGPAEIVAAGVAALCIAGTGAGLLRPPSGEQVRARKWAAAFPWRFALAPAAGAGAIVWLAQAVLGGGIFIGMFDALGWALVVFLVVGVAGVLLRDR
ncbi:MAG: hypothetical protein GEV11_14700 [Streptosporangiales bacterium]|nr:hypothetical protein [Streptosporangiales bacterium]